MEIVGEYQAGELTYDPTHEGPYIQPKASFLALFVAAVASDCVDLRSVCAKDGIFKFYHLSVSALKPLSPELWRAVQSLRLGCRCKGI